LDEGGRPEHKVFHSVASARKKKNRIKALRTEDGVEVKEEGEMAEVATNYFINIFSSHACTRTVELLNHIDPRVTLDMNDFLLMAFTEEEVRSALDSIGDLKAPGLDGIRWYACSLFQEILGGYWK
jgi:hypothetical protein